MSITATYIRTNSQLRLYLDDVIGELTISRHPSGVLLLNGNQIWASGVIPTVLNTRHITIFGSEGADRISFDESNGPLPGRMIYGMGGDDWLSDSDSDGRIHGGDGNDIINGNGGADLLNGGWGNDTIDGGFGKDIINGGRGDDIISGGYGDDIIWGWSGADLIWGDRGADRIDGGSGDDRIVWNNGDGNDVIEGGAGDDSVQVNGTDSAGDHIVIRPNGQRVIVERSNFGNFQLDIGTVETVEVNGQGGDDMIVGSTGLNGLVKLELDGGDGNDFVAGADGADFLVGGRGNDTLIGNRGNDVILGEDGSDLFVWYDGDGSDHFNGGEGRDIAQVNGDNSAGDDISVRANGSGIVVQGHQGHLFNLDIHQTEVVDINGQEGDDVIAGTIGLAGVVELDLDGGDGNDVLIGGDGGDTLRGGNDDDTIVGWHGNDVVLGGHGDDRVIWNHGDGSDAVFGGDGVDKFQLNGHAVHNDTVFVFGDYSGSADVQVRTWQPTDPDQTTANLVSVDAIQNVLETEIIDINTQGGDDVVIASYGLGGHIRLDIDAGNGNDRVAGGDSRDDIKGGDGDDILSGGKGFDRIEGGRGDDVINWRDGEGADYVIGGDGNDTFVLDARGVSSIVTQFMQNGDWTYINRGGEYAGYLSEVETIRFQGSDGTDFIFSDQNAGSAPSLDVVAGGGNDGVYGGAGNDMIDGGDGNDFVSGGTGNDVLIGGAGRDVQRGGTGDDLFRFLDVDDAAIGAGEIIYDFNHSGENDLIDLRLLDADDNKAGLQSFDFSTSGAASSSVWIEARTDISFADAYMVRGDVNGDTVADFEFTVLIQDQSSLDANNFLF